MPERYVLVLEEQEGKAVRSFPQTAAIELGSSPASAIPLKGTGIPPKHARIAADDGKARLAGLQTPFLRPIKINEATPSGSNWKLIPLEGSVEINGTAISGEWFLQNGDVVTLGENRITFFEETSRQTCLASGYDGFSRASFHLEKALDGLPDSEQDFLRKLAELEEALENATISTAVERMNKEDFKNAENILQRVRQCYPNNAHALLNLGICQAKLERFKEAETALTEAERCATDNQVREAARNFKRQLAGAMQQKQHRAVIQKAMSELNEERYWDAFGTIHTLPVDVQNEPPVKFLEIVARVKMMLAAPGAGGDRAGLRTYLAKAVSDLDDVIRRAGDPGLAGQARSMKQQLQGLISQIS